LQKSLTILLPVHNAQATLAGQVKELLDFLPEISSEFEILIVDDASTDSTEDVALDLARLFPQVRVLRQNEQRGHHAAVEAGLARTSGEIVFVNDPGVPMTETDLQRLWKMRDDTSLVMARAHFQPRQLDQHLLSKLMTWGDALKKQETPPRGSIQMLRRSAIESLTQLPEPEQAISVDRSQLTDAVRIVKQSQPGQVPTPPTSVTSMPSSSFSEQLSYF
jgi:cellulose synthase/poly-beta-1,6-N-acetylglucosamine synthase-like glycosyltransferase